MEVAISVFSIFIFLLMLFLAVYLLIAAVLGAISWFDEAEEKGFIGIVIYCGAWIFTFPFILVICIVAGLKEMHSLKKSRYRWSINWAAALP
jgi:hypothetical protein